MSYVKDKKHMLKPEKSKPQYNQIEFVNYRLTEEQVEDFQDNFSVDKFDVLAALAEITSYHYKVSISPDFENSCYIISVTGTQNSLNPNRCMTSRSDVLAEAIGIALYKLQDIFKWDYWEIAPKRNFWG